MAKSILISFVLLHLTMPSFAQDEHHAERLDHHRSRLAFFTGTSLVPTQLEGQKGRAVIFVPTYGLEYEHRINSWLAIGVMNELELQNYVITTNEGEEIDRSFIYVGSVIAAFKMPIKRLYFVIGPGYEIASHQNFNIIKAGFEYSIEINHGWDIAPEITVDQISNLYQTVTFGLAIGKKF